MEVLYPICAGMDVHKKDVKVCLITRDEQGRRTQTVRTFGTMTKDLLALRDWLQDHRCTVVAMESTGVYWKPIFNLLDGDFQVRLVNPTHVQQVPGRKTDVKDCECRSVSGEAQLLEQGLLSASFIPPLEIRDRRDLTRYRRQLVHEHTAEVHRLQKVLETANIKLASVATEVRGVSGRAILHAWLAGLRDAEQLAELSKGRLRNKKAELTLALEGRLRPHHARWLTRLLAHLEFLEEQIAECEAEMEEWCRPFQQEMELLDTEPGGDRRSAQDLIAEIGVDLKQFPSHKHLCSWAKISPGNNESAGQRHSGRTGKGNQWLRSILVECAPAAGPTKDTYLGSQFRRFAGRQGKQRAAVVVGHRILESAYFILRDKVPYQELGATYLAETKKAHVIRYHIRQLEQLGLKVDIQELPVAA